MSLDHGKANTKSIFLVNFKGYNMYYFVALYVCNGQRLKKSQFYALNIVRHVNFP